MARQRRFAFVERTTTGAERLMLANFDGSFGFSGPTARIITQMDEVPGDSPVDGSVPETYQSLSVAPDNAHVAALSVQVGTDFIDLNIAIYNMTTGMRTARFNEHSVTFVNRANCPCPVFDAYLAAEADYGVPQDQLDSYDYVVLAERSNVNVLRMVWSATGTLIATFGFDVAAISGPELGYAEFAIEVAVNAPSGAGVSILSRNAGVAPFAPMPKNPLAIRSLSPRTLPPGPMVIYYGKRPVTFYTPLWKRALLRIGWPWTGAGYRAATMVQGFVG
jgi:hypothetical protein